MHLYTHCIDINADGVYSRDKSTSSIKVDHMSLDPESNTKSASVNLRIDCISRNLIDHAAKLSGQSRSCFMIDAAKQKAEAILLEKTDFSLDEEKWKQFNEALDHCPESNAKLDKILAKTPLWK